MLVHLALLFGLICVSAAEQVAELVICAIKLSDNYTEVTWTAPKADKIAYCELHYRGNSSKTLHIVMRQPKDGQVKIATKGAGPELYTARVVCINESKQRRRRRESRKDYFPFNDFNFTSGGELGITTCSNKDIRDVQYTKESWSKEVTPKALGSGGASNYQGQWFSLFDIVLGLVFGVAGVFGLSLIFYFTYKQCKRWNRVVRMLRDDERRMLEEIPEFPVPVMV